MSNAPPVDWLDSKIAEASAEIADLSKDPKWSRHIFIDCGFNTCRVLGTFVKYLPASFRFYGFDILEELAPQIREFERVNGDRNVHLEFAAVSEFDGTVPFMEVNVWGPNFKGGSSLMESYISERRHGVEPRLIRAIDFAGWVTRKFDEDDFIVIKMDIEGAEYAVLEKMLDTGVLNRVGMLLVEFHWKYFDEGQREVYRLRHEGLLPRIKEIPNLRLVEWH